MHIFVSRSVRPAGAGVFTKGETRKIARRKFMRLPKNSDKYIVTTYYPWLTMVNSVLFGSLRLLAGSVRNEDRSLQCVGLWYISSYSANTQETQGQPVIRGQPIVGQYRSIQ